MIVRERPHRQRVLVTGGAGFIGSHLVEGLLEDGWDVVVVDDLSCGTRANLPTAVRLIVCDIATDAFRDAFVGERFDAVVHCAAQTSVPRSVAHPAEDRRVNLTGTENLLRFAWQHGVGRFVFFSSGGAVYGDTAVRASETTCPAPRSPYGVHKLAAEYYVAFSGIPYAILRPANVYGTRQRAETDGGVVAIFMERIGRGEPVTIDGDGSQIRDFVYVDDVVAAARALLILPESGIWNIASGVETTIDDLARQMGTTLGVTPTCVYGPTRPGDVSVSRLSNDRIVGQGIWKPAYTLAQGLAAMAKAGSGG